MVNPDDVLDREDGVYLSTRLIRSVAFAHCTNTALRIYLELMTWRDMKALPKDKWWIENNGEITFTYIQGEKTLGIKSSSFLRGIKLLVEVGLIELPYKGAGLKGDKNKFSFSKRWEKYGTKDFQEVKWEKDTRSIHYTKKNWEKKTGRKRKKKGKPPLKLANFSNHK